MSSSISSSSTAVNSPPPAAPGLRPYLRPVLAWLATSLVVTAALGFGLGLVADSLPAVSPERAAAALASSTDSATDRYPAPDFRLPSLDGPTLGPPDYPGEVVVIDLWATWCRPCVKQAEFLEEVHEEYDSGVRFLAINTGEVETTVRAYVEKTPFPYPVLLDPSQTVQTRYNASGLPTVLIVDVAGRVSFMNVGLAESATLRREIEKAKQAGVPEAAGQPAI